VFKTGPWGQGTVLLQLLGMLADDPLEAMDPLGPERVHLIAEALKLALADRDAWLADPEAADVPLSDLLSPAYLAARRAEIGETASTELRPGAPGGRDPGPARAALLALAGCEGPAGLGSGEPTFADLPEIEGDTVHLDVVDRWGNMVSATPSGGWLQSSPAVPGLGFSISTRGQMFWLDPRLPGALAPGRRPRVTLSPTLITREGRPWLAIGTPGGDQQDQWIGATLLRLLRGPRTGLQAAIEAPLFHTAHYVASFYPRAFQPGTLTMEGRFPPATVAALRDRGHAVQVMDDWSVGRVCAAGVAADGTLRAGASPRFAQAQAVGR
jgi:gamma-glutamyltranspeptidase/glutathione hydrolase